MLKKQVREWIKYMIEERKSFKVMFATGVTEVVEYKGFCWVLGGKAFSDKELLEKMVRYQNNERKFIIKFEAIEELEVIEELEEVENLTDDLFQESDIAYAEEAIERETCDLQDVVVNINESQIGRVVGKNNGKYRIVMSTGKLVELNRNEFYLDDEEPIYQPKENETIKVGYYTYEVFENDFVIRFSCKVLDRVFVYNKKFKDFKIMQISTNRALSAKRYFNNYYNIMYQLQEYIKRGVEAPSA